MPSLDHMANAIRQLLAALQTVTPAMPPSDALCHRGVVVQAGCAQCRRIAQAHKAIDDARQEGW